MLPLSYVNFFKKNINNEFFPLSCQFKNFKKKKERGMVVHGQLRKREKGQKQC